MSTPYYVTLTGSRTNAGDFLIRHRAHALLRWLRPDREIVDIDGWKPLSEPDLRTVNGARALILCGGPALQKRMVPRVYMLPSLDRIQVPIVSLGIGWKSRVGSWSDTRRYPFSDESVALLERMDRSGHSSSVRDYHSLAVLEHRGLKHFINAGCPANYAREQLESGAQGPQPMREPATIGFSVGLLHRESRSMAEQVRRVAGALRARYPKAAVTAAFNGDARRLNRAPLAADTRLTRWFGEHGVECVDLSGGIERFLTFYKDCDLHVGYRVHAHIYRTSLNLPTVLITEDGRGRGQQAMLGGVVLDGYASAAERWMKSLGRGLVDPLHAVPDLDSRLIALLDHPDWLQSAREGAWMSVRRHFQRMHDFVGGLP
jgi:Polysaccharide pyruvyl transferase